MSDDTPTVRFEQPGESNGHSAPDAGDSGARKSRTLILILSILGGVLLIGVVILLTLLFSRGMGGPSTDPAAEVSSSPSASETPSETPSESPSETPSEAPSESPSASPSAPPPPPPSNKTAITSFTVSPKTLFCNSSAPGGPFPLYVKFTWTTINVNQVGFGVATDDAIAAGMGWSLPPSGNSDDNFPSSVEFPCPSASQTYTLTVSGPDGKVSKKVTVTNNGDQQ